MSSFRQMPWKLMNLCKLFHNVHRRILAEICGKTVHHHLRDRNPNTYSLILE